MVKGNQKRLENAFNDYFRTKMLKSFEGSSYCIQEEGYGRKETCVALANEDLLVLGDIQVKGISILYYIGSKTLDAKYFLHPADHIGRLRFNRIGNWMSA